MRLIRRQRHSTYRGAGAQKVGHMTGLTGHPGGAQGGRANGDRPVRRKCPSLTPSTVFLMQALKESDENGALFLPSPRAAGGVHASHAAVVLWSTEDRILCTYMKQGQNQAQELIGSRSVLRRQTR